jgi:hypothetical protein
MPGNPFYAWVGAYQVSATNISIQRFSLRHAIKDKQCILSGCINTQASQLQLCLYSFLFLDRLVIGRLKLKYNYEAQAKRMFSLFSSLLFFFQRNYH